MPDAPKPAIASLEEIRAHLKASLEMIDQLHLSAGKIAEPIGQQADWISDWGTIGQAERILHRSTDTTVKHVREKGLGVFVDGRWRVDLSRVRAYLEGRSFPPLTPYPQRD